MFLTHLRAHTAVQNSLGREWMNGQIKMIKESVIHMFEAGFSFCSLCSLVDICKDNSS